MPGIKLSKAFVSLAYAFWEGIDDKAKSKRKVKKAGAH